MNKKCLKIAVILSALFFLSACSINFPWAKKTAPEIKLPPVEQPAPEEIIKEEPVKPVEPPLSKDQAYKGVVKIMVFTKDGDGFLNEAANGSGIIIDNSGLVLSNYHVVNQEYSFDKTEKEAGFVICLSKNSNEKPDCSYLGDLIAKDKDLDVALLKIKAVPSLSSAGDFPFLKLVEEDRASTSDEVSAIGYPGVGEDTVTITRGIVSGKMEKYGREWIKTDAVISFGSSGGAAINKDGQVMGITTASYSDMLGSLGYVINIKSLKNWIENNKGGTPKASSLEEKAVIFAKKLKEIENQNIFTGVYPSFSITKAPEWEFEYQSENALNIFKKQHREESGSINIEISRHASFMSMEDLEKVMKIMIDMDLIEKTEKVKINDYEGLKLISGSLSDSSAHVYYFPIREFDIAIVYTYGENDQDKIAIDSAINSLKIIDNKEPFTEIFDFLSVDPFLSLKSLPDWPVLRFEEKGELGILEGKNPAESDISLSLEKIADSDKTLKNEEYLKRIRKKIEEMGRFESFGGQETRVLADSASEKINEEIKNAIKIETATMKTEEIKTLKRSLMYAIKINDKYYLNIVLTVNSGDKKAYEKSVADLKKILATLTLKEKKPDADNDGLSDEDEAKYGTNINNADTDGDGYKDGDEVKNGYNPNGPGKLGA